MGRTQQFLRPMDGARFIDAFDALSPRWQSLAGTLAVNGGALRAATLGDWGLNKVTNGTLEAYTGTQDDGTSDTFTGWSNAGTGAGATIEATATANGGANAVKLGPAIGPRLRKNITVLPGATLQNRFWTRASGGTGSLNLGWYNNTGNATIIAVTATGVTGTTYAQYTQSGVVPIGCISLALDYYSQRDGSNEWVYLDDVVLYRQNAPAILRGWRSPAFTATMAHISPAALTTPFGFICRYTTPLDYWEVRVLPNTAGNDLQIIQVTAGVETVRAEADIDWTAGDTDELSVTAQGSTISTAHKKSGAGVWTAGPSYASATQGATSPQIGVMLYEAGVNRLARFEVKG